MDGSTWSSGDALDSAWFRSHGATGPLSGTVKGPESNTGTCIRAQVHWHEAWQHVSHLGTLQGPPGTCQPDQSLSR